MAKTKQSFKERMFLVAVRNICYAQIASNAGKGRNIKFLEGFGNLAAKRGYAMKVEYINRAKAAIAACQQCGVTCGEIRKPDQGGKPSVITYFRIKDPKFGSLQVSFHTPADQYEGAAPSFGWSGEGQKWRKKIDCNDVVAYLIGMYFR